MTRSVILNDPEFVEGESKDLLSVGSFTDQRFLGFDTSFDGAATSLGMTAAVFNFEL